MEKSKRYSLNARDFKSIIIGGAIAGAGAVLTYLLSVLPEIDFGTLTPLIAGVLAIFINSTMEALKNSPDMAGKIYRGAMIASAGVILTYASEWLAGADFGPSTAFVVPIAGMLINSARKYLSGPTPIA